MTTSEFEKIGVFFNAHEAEHARSVLGEHGIQAFVEGAEVNTTLSYVGSALGGVKLFVGSGDAAKAQEILDDFNDSEPGESWYCTECDELVEAGFDICWSCGETKSEVAGPVPNAEKREAPASDAAVSFSEERLVESAKVEADNPYAPTLHGQRKSSSPAPTSSDPVVEAILVRAWRAAVIGIVLLPVVLHIYSAYLLIKASHLSVEFSVRETRLYFQTIILNVVVTLIWSMCFWMLSSYTM